MNLKLFFLRRKIVSELKSGFRDISMLLLLLGALLFPLAAIVMSIEVLAFIHWIIGESFIAFLGPTNVIAFPVISAITVPLFILGLYCEYKIEN